MKVGLNGALVQAEKAVISAYDHGFLYGIGLFETFRTYGGAPYLLERHMDRLRGGCRELGIILTLTEEQLADQVSGLLEANGLSDGYIRLTVSAGTGELGLPSSDYAEPTILLMAKPLAAVGAEWLAMEPPAAKELRLLHTRRNSPEGSVRFKSLHYMNNIIAKRELLGLGAADSSTETGDIPDMRTEAARFGAPEGLMLSREGWLAEGIVSNLFFVSKNDGVICTPSIDTGILPGVTRKKVLELARGDGFAVEEGHYVWEELLDAREIWLTNSVQELVPVELITDLDGRSVVVGISQAEWLGDAGFRRSTGYAECVELKGNAESSLAPGHNNETGSVSRPVFRRLLELYREDIRRNSLL
jgi:4-amino-4-deoxychorismate lyase